MRFYMSLLFLIPVAIVGVAYALSKRLLAERVPENVYGYFEASCPDLSGLRSAIAFIYGFDCFHLEGWNV